jgi:hypothetical protein
LLAGVAMLATTALLPATAAASHGHGVLPKGTPYAAEVIATITGESHLTLTSTETTFNVCEAESKVADENDEYDLDWKARYPQVTVPVAGKRQLGRASKKLELRVEPTSDGTGGLTDGTFHLSGHSPPTDLGNQGAGSSDCAKQPYEASGTFTATRPTFEDLTYADGVFDQPRQLFEFDLGTIDAATPAAFSLPDGSQGDPVAELNNAVAGVPTPAAILNVPPGISNVPTDFQLKELEALVEKPSVTLYRRTSGSHDCGAPATAEGELKCKVEWNYQFRVKLTRRFLYLTKARYAR